MKINKGVLLLTSGLIAILLTNIGLNSFFHTVKETSFFGLGFNIEQFVEDFLLTVFFLCVGSELKLEFRVGSFKNPKKAGFPIFGALGGMVFPILIFLSLAYFTSTISITKGFAIPSATDIAFSIGILSLLCPNLDKRVRLFLLTLAVADDIGGIIIIALFYSKTIDILSLIIVLVLCILWFFILKVKTVRLYLCPIIFVAACYFMIRTGISSAILGVLLGLLISTKPLNYKIKTYDNIDDETALLLSQKAHKSLCEVILNKLSNIVDFVILPIFAFCMLTIPLNSITLNFETITLFLCIAIGLFIGKPLGIMLFSLIIVKLTPFKFEKSLSLKDYLGVSCLAGTGFTVSFLIVDLSFDSVILNDISKLAVLIGSFLSILSSFIVFKLVDKRKNIDI